MSTQILYFNKLFGNPKWREELPQNHKFWLGPGLAGLAGLAKSGEETFS